LSDPPLADALETITERSGIPYPNGIPYAHITVALVVWNEERRIGPLLDYLRPFFSTVGVVVQESPDNTERVVREYADIIVQDQHRGYGDASFGPKLLPHIRTPWTFKVDADEWPSEDLLRSLSSATWYADYQRMDGIWVSFHSSVDDIEYTEQHGHLRLFRTKVGWPSSLHSRPMIDNTAFWQTGYIRHDRSLDELVQDYIRYYDVGRGNSGWEQHNKDMMYHACSGTAAVKGWDYVRSFEWWPRVRSVAFGDQDPGEVPSSR